MSKISIAAIILAVMLQVLALFYIDIGRIEAAEKHDAAIYEAWRQMNQQAMQAEGLESECRDALADEQDSLRVMHKRLAEIYTRLEGR